MSLGPSICELIARTSHPARLGTPVGKPALLDYDRPSANSARSVGRLRGSATSSTMAGSTRLSCASSAPMADSSRRPIGLRGSAQRCLRRRCAIANVDVIQSRLRSRPRRRCSDRDAASAGGDAPRVPDRRLRGDRDGRQRLRLCQSIAGVNAANSALYFPWVMAPDPLPGECAACVPPMRRRRRHLCRIDATRGVWKGTGRHRGQSAGVTGRQCVAHVDDASSEFGSIKLGVDCLRQLPTTASSCRGARTLAGGNGGVSDWMYVRCAASALFIERQPCIAGTKWAALSSPMASRCGRSCARASSLHAWALVQRRSASQGSHARRRRLLR